MQRLEMPAADWKERARARRRRGGCLRRFFTDLGPWAPVLLILGVFFFGGAGSIGGAAAAAVASGAGGGNAGMQSSPLVGIDLGTTYSVAAVWRNGKVEVVPNPLGNRITPSVVSWREGERLVGDAALAGAAHNPRGTVTAVKRLMGQHWTNPSVQADAALVGYNVTAGREGRATVQVAVGDKIQEFSPEEISAMVLGELKASTEAYLGEPVTQAVITVPAYFSDAQRQATKVAGQIAGLEVTRVINEPTAAALAYGLDKKGDEQKILVFDLGGGTLDVSLLTIDEGFFEVVATHGDTHLGGEDFDARLVRHVLRQVKEKRGRDLSRNADAVAAIRRAAESAKRRLSSGLEATIELDSLELSETITRAKFEAINSDLFRSCLAPVRKVLSDAELTVEGIDQVVLVGGSTRIPKIRSMLADMFGSEKLNFNIHPDEAIAYGAAVMAASVRAGKKGNSEADLPEVLLVDVAPLTLGVETVGGQMSPILPRNTPVPESKKRVFTTVKDNQAVVRVNVYEGERALVKDNRLLGTFDLNIPPVPRGVPQIEVEFLVDKNNMLSVTARDLFCTPDDTNPRCSANLVVPSDSLRLNKDEVDALVAEAQASAESDRAATAHIERRHELEQLAFSLQAAAADAEGVSRHLSSSDRSELRNSAREALKWLDSNPAGEMSECMDHIESLRLAAASLRPEEGVEEMDTI